MYVCCGFCCGQVPSRQRFAARSLITTSFNILQYSLKKTLRTKSFERKTALKEKTLRRRRRLWVRGFEGKGFGESALRRRLWGKSFDDILWGGGFEESALRRSERLWTRSFEGENLHTHTCSKHFRAFLVHALRRWGSQPKKCIGSCHAYQRMRWSNGCI